MKLIVLLFNLFFLGTPSSTSIVDKAIAIQKQYIVTNYKYVVMVDYSKSIDEERLYIVNTKTAKIEMTSIVSHGVNSGKEYAVNFSNVKNSKKSSLGAYLTENTYYGRFGYSLYLKGLDKTNSLAKERAIIFHSTKKMHTKWSHGCFSLPEKNTRKIIDMIKGGCLVYAYKNN
ncbi:YkuD_like domain containing protein [Flavobacteriaceae bacterium]